MPKLGQCTAVPNTIYLGAQNQPLHHAGHPTSQHVHVLPPHVYPHPLLPPKRTRPQTATHGRQYWKAVVSQHESGEAPTRRRSNRSRRRTGTPPRRSLTLSPVNTSPSVASTTATDAASTGASAVARAAIERPDIARGGGGSVGGGVGGGGGGSGMAHADAEAAPPAAAIVTRKSPPRVQSMSEAAAAAMTEFLRDEAGAAGAEQDRKRTRSDVPERPTARDSGGHAGLRTPTPASPATARKAASAIDKSAGVDSEPGAGEEALRSCLAMLEAGGFLRLCEGGKTFVCDDMMLMDQVRTAASARAVRLDSIGPCRRTEWDVFVGGSGGSHDIMQQHGRCGAPNVVMPCVSAGTDYLLSVAFNPTAFCPCCRAVCDCFPVTTIIGVRFHPLQASQELTQGGRTVDLRQAPTGFPRSGRRHAHADQPPHASSRGGTGAGHAGRTQGDAGVVTW